MCFFAGSNIWAVVKSHYTKESVHNDKLRYGSRVILRRFGWLTSPVLSKMSRIYPQVTAWEWLSIFLVAVTTLIIVIIKGNGVYMPLFTFFAALG
jgi:hypothetical protein